MKHLRDARLDSEIQLRARERRRSGVNQARGVALLVLAALAATACVQRTTNPTPADSSEWREFDGTWTATGHRRSIPMGGGRTSAIVELSGTMLLHGQGRPGVGFLAETVAFSDSASGLVGRAVWTDENGDQVFSELTGEGTAAKNRIVGTFVGGTGRYTGVYGTYEFAWRYVVESEDGEISGRAVDLKGRFQIARQATGATP